MVRGHMPADRGISSSSVSPRATNPHSHRMILAIAPSFEGCTPLLLTECWRDLGGQATHEDPGLRADRRRTGGASPRGASAGPPGPALVRLSGAQPPPVMHAGGAGGGRLAAGPSCRDRDGLERARLEAPQDPGPRDPGWSEHPAPPTRTRWTKSTWRSPLRRFTGLSPRSCWSVGRKRGDRPWWRCSSRTESSCPERMLPGSTRSAIGWPKSDFALSRPTQRRRWGSAERSCRCGAIGSKGRHAGATSRDWLPSADAGLGGAGQLGRGTSGVHGSV